MDRWYWVDNSVSSENPIVTFITKFTLPENSGISWKAALKTYIFFLYGMDVVGLKTSAFDLEWRVRFRSQNLPVLLHTALLTRPTMTWKFTTTLNYVMPSFENRNSDFKIRCCPHLILRIKYRS